MYQLDREIIESVLRRGEKALVSYCQKNHIHWLVTGNSGGRDSAVTLAWVQRACQLAKKRGWELNSVGVLLPCKSPDKYTKIGRIVNRAFGAEEIEVDLTEAYEWLTDNIFRVPVYFGGPVSLDDTVKAIRKRHKEKVVPVNWNWSGKIAQGNIRARLRMITLYHIARMFETGMVMSTDNLSEYWMGFWTICGDVGDYCLIQNILKGLELEDIARYLKVPAEVLAQPPDDGLGVTNGGDAAQLGAVYSVVDSVMVGLIQQGFKPDGSSKQLAKLPPIANVDPTLVQRLATRSVISRFKRQGTVVLSRQQLGLPPIERIKLNG